MKYLLFFFFKQKTAYEMRISDWSSDVCSSDLGNALLHTAYGFAFLYADALDPATVRKALSTWSNDEGEGWPSWAFSNHDAPRHISRCAQGRDPQRLARLTLMLLLALRGNAFLYQGEELGLPTAAVPFDRLQDPAPIHNQSTKPR